MQMIYCSKESQGVKLLTAASELLVALHIELVLEGSARLGADVITGEHKRPVARLAPAEQ